MHLQQRLPNPGSKTLPNRFSRFRSCSGILDTFDLPAEATLLMTNDACKYQAYRIGRNIYGFQFHFEVTPEIVMSWMAMKNDWIEANYPNLDAQIAAQVQQ